MNDIKLNFSYTKEQVVNAYRSRIFPTDKAKRRFAIFTILILGSAIFINILQWNENKASEGQDQRWLSIGANALVILAVIWLIQIVFVLLGYFYLPQRAFKNQLAFKGKYLITINEEQSVYIHQLEEDNSSAQIPVVVGWEGYTGRSENEESILLFQKNRSMSIFPKAAFQSESDLIAFKQLISNKPNIQLKVFK